jgi:hypothetical protein
MKKNSPLVKRLKRTAGWLLCLSFLAGCAAQPPTHYYDLTARVNAEPTRLPGSISLGVGPVSLPKVLDRPGIVTRQHENTIDVATYHIWAGELEETFTRVLADTLAATLQQDTVWASPWDNRFRPEYQLRIFVDRFSGELNGRVTLSANWTLLKDYGNEAVRTYRYRTTVESGEGYLEYVSALNDLLSGFADEIATKLSAALASTGDDGMNL